MKVNYDAISRQYDDVREADIDLINHFLEEIKLGKTTKVLDFGCGTGNYSDILKRVTDAEIYGVEPSDGMREKAAAKNSGVVFKKGDHEKIPFPEDFFDFIYMTDVIHHIPDLDQLFREYQRVLKQDGKICIETESHEQIENRFYVKYFPSTAEVDKARYPEISAVKAAAERNGLTFVSSVTTGKDRRRMVDGRFLELVEKKGYSMFHLIPADEYEKGLQALKDDLQAGSFATESSGGTLIWLQK